MTEGPDQTRIAERYAVRRSRSRGVMIIAAVVLGLLIVWTGWTAWTHSHPKVSSAMNGWTVTSPNEVTLTVVVKIYDDGSHPVCTAQAYASDHSTVGQLRYTPIDGSQTVTLETEREPTSIDWTGCTAQGQDDPQ